MIAPNYTVGKILVAVGVPVTAEIMALSLDQSTINSLALLGVAIIGLYTARQSKVATTEIASVKKTGEAVHVLSNSAMGAQLKINVQYAKAAALLAHRLAAVTGEKGDEAAAAALDLAVGEQEVLLNTHVIQQAKVDAVKS